METQQYCRCVIKEAKWNCQGEMPYLSESQGSLAKSTTETFSGLDCVQKCEKFYYYTSDEVKQRVLSEVIDKRYQHFSSL